MTSYATPATMAPGHEPAISFSSLAEELLTREVLTSEQLHAVDLLGYEEYTDEQCMQLLERIRAGDIQARDELVLYGTASYVYYWARRLTRAFSWASPRIEVLDLASVGHCAVLEYLDRALEKAAPLAYVKACAKYRMYRFCYRQASSIATPADEEPYVVKSLDAPVKTGDTFTTLEEYLHLAAPPIEASPSSSDEQAYEGLYRALEALPEGERHILEHLYGLNCHEPKGMHLTAKALGLPGTCNVNEMRKWGLKRLRGILSVASDGAVYTTQQAQQVLGVSRSRVAQLAKDHGLRSCGQGLYSKRDVDALAAQRMSDVYTSAQAQQVLGVSRSSLHSVLVRQGGGIRQCAKGLYRKQDVDALAAQRAQKRRRVAQ